MLLRAGEDTWTNVKKSYQIKPGDQVQIDKLERYLSPRILEEAPDLDLEIYHETDDYLVVYKPKGVLSHPTSVWEVEQPSIVGRLYHHYRDLPSIGNFIRAGLVHRLDRETDGLMIIAKSELGLSYFQDLFSTKTALALEGNHKQSRLDKYYRAVVRPDEDGKTFLDWLDVQLPYLIDSEVTPRTPGDHQPKRALTMITSIEAMDALGDYLISMKLLTGRTHQIRIHLSEAGLPIIGDHLYGVDEDQEMQLSAYRLQFIDPHGERIDLEVE